MSHPILYSSTETNFEHDGIGILSDCILCEVTEERNGSYELTMKYPLDGVYYEDIKNRSIIKVMLDKFRNEQPFRVYAISRPLNGIVTINAQHISYDLSGIPASPFSADTASDALSGLKYNAVADCPFDFWTDKSTKAEFEFFAPASIRSRLGGVSGSILDVYGGEYEFDNFTVKLHEYRGMNRGVSVQYGVNLTDIKQEENCASVYTGIMPYWNAEEGVNLVMLPEKIVKASGEYDFEKIKVVDFSSDFEVEPTEDELRSAAESYIKDNDIGIPSVSLTVSFAQLDKDAESVSLCDTVNIEFAALKVEATAKIIKIVYDVLLDRVKSISLGNARTNIADTIVSQKNSIDDISSIIPKKTDIEAAIESATKWITNGAGYMIAVKDEAGNWKEICSLDRPSINSAVNVWRWNNGGFGHSKSGYNGPYETAITQDGQIVADFITAGSMSANRVKTGVLASSDGTVNLNLDDGGFHVSATKYATLSRSYFFSYDNDGNLILTYTGDKPNYSIDEDGNLILTYTGDKPDIWADEDGYILTTEESLGTAKVLGTLSTDIDGNGTWESKFVADGKTLSSLYFDFSISRFAFEGHVVATSGEIGGFYIGKNFITSDPTNKYTYASVADGVYIGSDGIGVGDFYVSKTGAGTWGDLRFASTNIRSGEKSSVSSEYPGIYIGATAANTYGLDTGAGFGVTEWDTSTGAYKKSAYLVPDHLSIKSTMNGAGSNEVQVNGMGIVYYYNGKQVCGFSFNQDGTISIIGELKT